MRLNRDPLLGTVMVLALGGMIWANHLKFLAWDARIASMDAEIGVTEPAPDFRLSTASDASITLSDLRGRPVVLEFWASWCVPCRDQHRAVERLPPDLLSRVQLLAINVREPPEDIHAYLMHQPIEGEVLLDGDGAVADLYRVTVLPTTVFIGRDGIVKLRHSGGAVDLAAFFENGLAAPAGSPVR